MAAVVVSAAPTAASAAPTMAYDDVQGLLRFSFKNHTEACFLLLRIKAPAAACAWLAGAPVTSAVALDPPPATVLQVAFTHEGLRALGVPEVIAGAFATEFVAGMVDANRSRRLGDVGPNDPAAWAWGVGARMPHAVVLLYAMPGLLTAWRSQVEAELEPGFDLLTCLPTADMGGREPFGFIDGISQPQPDWERQRPVADESQLEYTNLSCLGEFVLGYPNEYALYTPRPLLDPPDDANGILPHAEDAPGQPDLGRNGSYLVLRQLRQDVRAFWQAVDGYANGQPDLRTRLAEAMVGRTLQGEPLVGLVHEVIAGNAPGTTAVLNAFTYRADPSGVRCPIGAHIRRTNPRTADLPPGGTGMIARAARVLGLDAAARGEDRVASTRFHRLLRRGREYGEAVSLQQALADAPVAESGLQFMCLGANLERQFEFVQSAWVVNANFAGLGGVADPLLGNREPGLGSRRTDGFTVPQADGPDQRLTGLPRFITVAGGAYFFLPGLRALKFLATVDSGG